MDDSTIFPPEKRRRGGQPGNHNALKNGFYSHLILPDEKKSLDVESFGGMNDEMAILRALLYRTIKSIKENPPASMLDHVRALRAVATAITCMQGMARVQKAVFDDGRYTMEEIMQQVMEELDQIPPEED